jgi:hypothetical protein
MGEIEQRMRSGTAFPKTVQTGKGYQRLQTAVVSDGITIADSTVIYSAANPLPSAWR